MSEFKIEKGIPIPEPKQGRPTPLPFRKMEVGDCVWLSMEASKVRARVWSLKPLKFTVRKEGDGSRVWRIA